MKIRFALAGLMGVGGSILTLLIFYTDYSMIGVNTTLAFEKVQKWPWLWLPVGLTAFSCTVPFLSHFIYSGHEDRIGKSHAGYAFGLLWVPILLAYPGSKKLGVWSDSVGIYAIFGICLAQYLVTKLISSQILRESRTE